MMSSGRSNATSCILTIDENQKILTSLGPRRTTECMAIVRMYIANSNNKWNKKCCGVAAVVRDATRKSYFIKVMDVGTCFNQFEQELFFEMEYTIFTSNFHTFQSDTLPIGFAFANSGEASSFHETVLNVLSRRLNSLNSAPLKATEPARPVLPPEPSYTDKSISSISSNNQKSIFRINKKSKKTNARITVGEPFDFRHVQHMGFDKESAQFSVSAIDNQALEGLLKTINSEHLLKDKRAQAFAYKFIQEKYGMEKLKSTLATPPIDGQYSKVANNRRAPQQPPPPSTHGRPSHPPPPPPPPAPAQSVSAALSAKPMIRPPPVPRARHPPTPRPHSRHDAASDCGFVPPPPPPPPAPAPPPPPSVPAPREGPPQSKHEVASPIPSTCDVLGEIRAFNRTGLKKVEASDVTASGAGPVAAGEMGDLAKSLGLALQNLLTDRRACISSESSSDSDSFE